jgi:hypothetical protein
MESRNQGIGSLGKDKPFSVFICVAVSPGSVIISGGASFNDTMMRYEFVKEPTVVPRTFSFSSTVAAG